jgi:hypothetical protein
MPCPTLFAALLLAASSVPGTDVDHPADDGAIFARLETATTKLAEQSSGRLTRVERLEQAKRTKTDLVRPAPPSRTPLSAEETYRRAAAASVVIASAYKCDKCSKWHHTLASGFAISGDGVIATNHHVAAGATGEAMGVMTADGSFHPVVEVLAADKPHDVALIRIEAEGLTFLPLRDDAPAGTPIHCYSHPASTFGCFSEGVITRYYKMKEPERAGAVFMQVTADYARGSSGGSILDACGNAVGMVASTSPIFACNSGPASSRQGRQRSQARDTKPADGAAQLRHVPRDPRADASEVGPTELRRDPGPGISDDVADITLAGHEHQEALETEAEPRVRDGTVATRVDIPAVAFQVEAMGLASPRPDGPGVPRAGCRR